MKRSQAPSVRLAKRGVKEEDIKLAFKFGCHAVDQLLNKGTFEQKTEIEEQGKTKQLNMDEENNDCAKNEVVKENGPKLYYWCIFKPKNKDPKPGILEVGFDKLLLFDMEAKQTGSVDITRGEVYEIESADKENKENHIKVETQTIKIKNKEIIIDTGKCFIMSQKEVKVLISFPAEKYVNGSIFLQKPPTEEECEKIVQKKEEKKKMVCIGRVLLSRKAKDFIVPYKNAVIQRKRNEPLFNPNDPDAVVLYQPTVTSRKEVAVVVDPLLGLKLRPHQKAGVKFMYDCVMGLKQGFRGNGCILADGMGLGKTIQAVTLIWTLLRQGPNGEPTCKKVMVVAPSSLVGNWENEFKKWLGDAAPRVVGVSCSGAKTDQAISDMDFGYAEIMVISYDQLRIHIDKIEKIKGWGLLICDEGHRLKNADIKSSQAVNRVPTKRRVILSGTPIQNELGEFYAMVSFVNPDVLGSLSAFKRIYEEPIMKSRQFDCTPEEKYAGNQRSKELTRLTKLFILRRTSKVNQKYLPPKVQHVVFCSLTPLQKKIYTALCTLKNKPKGKDEKKSCQFQILTALKKVSNHPWLIQDFVKTFPEVLDGILPKGEALWDMELSGKTAFLAKLLAFLRKHKEKIVIVSNYTETLNFIAHHCKKCGYPYIQLDGSVAATKRTQMVNRFNNPELDEFIFLLSSKAGGCGLNLVGGANLVMFDPDWNPANDEQAMGRVWRDGQKKKCHIYRTLSAGTVEEKMYQRQIKKLELAGKVVEGGDDNDESTFDDKQLKELCIYKDTACETHDLLGCTCGAGSRQSINWAKNDGKLEVLRKEWKHFNGKKPLEDDVLRELDSKTISFLFSKEDEQLKDDGNEEIVEEKMPGEEEEEAEEDCKMKEESEEEL
ncbi:DNA repair and recombination protein RAD54B, putative [Entamoeba dispar SAW760]|uniref:DNA repair and recombination protein RAD54B, putative n=1 Tax=Entamoeba dispar (strain ATCC PRA-260 / SAW760) TaxID=370354 RepID=B0E8P0_ENTDS|nr:DNA repair and recombination protein RAD54B, putative [Entamoeba dispar SAW760]EDR29108.1 DNA repair and recombination protein RAD54B, putative [Entamoeba dispar SAW760]|eukprot:EDR29108.1 DNA repair and recombination protein RAD54B, putative [Entamoeba dispar SAW760]